MPVFPRASRAHRGRGIAGGAALLVLVLLVAARLALTPMVAAQIRRQLNAHPGMSGDFADLSLSVVGLRCGLEGLELHVKPPGGTPLTARIQSVEAHLLWRDLFRSRLAFDARLDHAKLTVVIETQEETNEMIRQLKHLASMPHLGALLESQPAFRIARVDLRDLEVLIADHTEAGVSRKSAEVWVHGIAGNLENFADRVPLLGNRPTTLALTGQVQRSGIGKVFLTGDPLADQLDVAAELTLEHLDVRELYGFIASRSKLQASGTLDARAKLEVHDARIEGTIRPVVENLHVSAAEQSAGIELKGWLANAGPARNGIPSVIPISGSVHDPRIDLGPTLSTLLHESNP